MPAASDDSPHPHAYPPIENSEHVRTRQPGSMWPLFFAAMAANFGGLVMGTGVGWTGPALNLIINNGNLSNFEDDEKHNNEFPVSDDDGNWIASLFPIGALIGGFMGGKIMGRLGRKTSMFVITILHSAGYLLLATAYNKWMFFFGRIISGYGCGVTTISVPTYVSEIASPNVRGMLGSCFQVMITIGVLYVDIIGAFVSWRWISVACLGVVFAWSLLLLTIPESPAFLLMQRDFEGARASLQSLRGHQYVESELSEIQDVVHHNVGREASIEDLLKPQNLKPLSISLLLMFGQQLSGINAVIFFSVTIFEAAKTTLNSFIESIIVAGTMVVATCVAAIFIDRLGRRLLINLSAVGMFAALFALGAYFWIQPRDPETALEISFLPVTSLSIYILSFSVGFGPIPWLMMSELFSPDIKSLASSIATAFNWSLCFVVAQGFGPLAAAVGKATVFWVFGTVVVIVFALCLFFVPETKGKTLDEIQDLFRQSSESRPEDEQDIITNTVDDLEDEIQRESDIVSA